MKFTNQKYKQTILLVTHDEKIALQANRIITIGDGKIIKRRGDEVMKITAQLALSQMKVNKKERLQEFLQSHLQHHLLQL